MNNIALLIILVGLVIFSGYKYYKESRTKSLHRQRHR